MIRNELVYMRNFKSNYIDPDLEIPKDEIELFKTSIEYLVEGLLPFYNKYT